MNKKYAAVIILILLIAIGWLGYQKIVSHLFFLPKRPAVYQGKITIGFAPWPGYLPLYVAQDKGYFNEAGLQVDLKPYDGLSEISKDYVAGNIQGRANLTLEALNEFLGGLDHKVILAIDYSSGSDAIAARKDILTVKDFAAKRVAFEPNSLEEFFLTWVLNENGLELSDITAVHANPEDSAKKLMAGEVDVAVTYEPFLSKCLQLPDYHVVFSSADAPGLITDILTFRTEFINAYPETINAIVKAYFKALKFWKENPEETETIAGRYLKDTKENVAKQLKGVTLLDERDNQTAFTFAAGPKSLYGNLRLLAKFVRRHRPSGTVQLDTDRLIDRRFLKNYFNEQKR